MVAFVALLAASLSATYAEPLADAEASWARDQVVAMQKDRRGPYSGVAWFCNDGTKLPPKAYACKEHGGGHQYGVFKPEAERLGEDGIFVGTVLAALKPEDVANDGYYRARALVIERYLERALDGWVLHAAKGYRGARQVEDEQLASRNLLIALMKDPALFDAERALAIRLIRALPYGKDEARADDIRLLSGALGDADERFEALRYKIHTSPEPSDIEAVETYARTAPKAYQATIEQLLTAMREEYDPTLRKSRMDAIRGWLPYRSVRVAIARYLDAPDDAPAKILERGADVLAQATKALRAGEEDIDGERNVLLLQAMALIEQRWIGQAAPLATLALDRSEGLRLIGLLVDSAGFLGTLSPREAEAADAILKRAAAPGVASYVDAVEDLSRLLDWQRARYHAALGLPLARYGAVEPEAPRIIDAIMRSGASLVLATLVDRLQRDAASLGGSHHRLVGFDPSLASGLRGENAGLALGRLRFASDKASVAALGRGDIALLGELVPDLPPVAGILTIGPSGSLSHVALLARNLGVPHAAISQDLADVLQKRAGDELVLGVSADRNVLLAPLGALSPAEQATVVQPKLADKPFLKVDAARLDLATARILPLAEVSEKDSGIRVGPKAAELGHLKRLFPELVSGAVVLPFGLFVRHVNRPAKDGGPSPLARLKAAYAAARSEPPEVARTHVLAELARFRDAIATLPFADGFEAEVRAALETLGPPGSFGVFVRSDTNVEDLKEFTGAGLNLTVPNRVATDGILAAIRAVWASPFTERAYRWRERVLVDPAEVYPSVLLHRTVPSELSGVLVTTDLEEGGDQAFTVSVSEGVAAVVEGGSPETLVVRDDGSVRLLASSRTTTRKLIPPPPREGVVVEAAEGRDPLLDAKKIATLRGLVRDVREKMPKRPTPWDVELGFVGDRLYLLQIRPLRTAKAPMLSPLLRALDTAAPTGSVDAAGALP